MCGIAGFFSTKRNFLEWQDYYQTILHHMCEQQKHRGPDAQHIFLSSHVGFSHTRLSIIDVASGTQPMLRTYQNHTYAIVYNGELYNMKEIKDTLRSFGWQPETQSDTELILLAYMQFGPDFVSLLNGIFAFAIYDEKNNTLLLYRDRNGVKPLFFSELDQITLFASEPKGLFAYSDLHPVVAKEGLQEIFGIGPARTPGKGIYENVHEVLPGHFIQWSEEGKKEKCYWKLEAHTHEDNYEKTVRKTRELLIDAISRQTVSDVPIGTFLSGGIDSSLVTSICKEVLPCHTSPLQSFSFDFVDNEAYFKPSMFQPTQDRPYVDEMVAFLHTEHTYLTCDIFSQADLLSDSVRAHDLPAMADVDSSMLYFCRKVKPYVKVVLTGECADEIFGGYPWFHKDACFKANTFPWTMDLSPRKMLLKDDFLDFLQLDSYVKAAYEASLAQTPRLPKENSIEERRREISYLNMTWFMQTLLDRMDRTSMYSGLEARVPFADHRIISYLYNVPWSMKAHQGEVKGLLRDCAQGFLPESIRKRKKSPYPKTYDRNYEKIIKKSFLTLMQSEDAPIKQFIDEKKLNIFLESPTDYGKPWYGQLMAGPQLLAYMLQINIWLTSLPIQLDFS